MTRVLICGGRNYDPDKAVAWLNMWAERDFRACGKAWPPSLVIHGAAKGADEAAQLWAISNGFKVLGFPADWEKHGKAAGPIRNQEMLDLKPDVVISFEGGRGTLDMRKRAYAAGVTILQVPA